MSHPITSSPPQAPPSYPDLAAVLAGLSRMRTDMIEIESEMAEAIEAVSFAMQAPGDREGARRALKNQQAQLVWLSADTGAMLAALAEAEKEHTMPGHRISVPYAPNPIHHLYLMAESLRHLGATLPEEQAGLAMLLLISSDEVRHCAELLDDNET